jgi:hypothetical protein
MNGSGEIMKKGKQESTESSQQSDDVSSNAAATPPLTDIRRAEIAWNRAIHASSLDYWRRVNEAWSEYHRATDQLARQWSDEYLDAAERTIGAHAEGEASPQNAAEASRESQRHIYDSARAITQRRRAAERQLDEERQRAWRDAADAYEAANASYQRAVADLLPAAAKQTIDPGNDEGGGDVARFDNPGYGYRWV